MSIEWRAKFGPLTLEKGTVKDHPQKLFRWLRIRKIQTDPWGILFQPYDRVVVERSNYSYSLSREQIDRGPLRSPTSLFGTHVEFRWINDSPYGRVVYWSQAH